jgi:glycine betaine catabolism B
MTFLRFVKKVQENGDTYTFYFERLGKVRHKAGQHGLFVVGSLARPHIFSLASSPEEPYVMVGTHVGSNSPFKRKLMVLREGERVFMFGPILFFTFQKRVTDYVFLAQGIGITPFRSMLVHAHDTPLAVSTTLIHVDKANHTYRELTEQYATKAAYPTNPEEFQALVRQQDPHSSFYLSGSPRFVAATKQLLRECGVPRSRMRSDWFLGY